MTNVVEIPANSPSRSNQRGRDGSQLPRPKRQRMTRASAHSSKTVDYNMKYHPLDEVLRPNYSATLKHRLLVSSKKAQSQQESRNNDSNDSTLRDENKLETTRAPKPNLSKINRPMRCTAQNLDKNKYNMSYHPLHHVVPEMITNRVSTWLKAISVQETAESSIHPPHVPQSTIQEAIMPVFNPVRNPTAANFM